MSILTSEIIKELKDNKYKDILTELYGAPAADMQRDRYIQAAESFIDLYGDIPAQIYRAAGRTEVGGNHTDHERGKVLAASVDLDTIAVAAPSEDKRVKLKSEGYRAIELDLEDLEINKDEYETSHALIRGVAAGLDKRGYKIGGFKAYVTSNVLSGSGLSSSAAFEVLMGNVLMGLYNPDKEPDRVMLAKVGQEAENNYFGKPSGLMDQMACSYGGLIRIDFEKAADPDITMVETSPTDMGYALCIVDTKGSHAGLTSEYAAVTNELRKVCSYFGKEVLREVEEADFYKNIPKLRELAGDRAVNRAIHIYNDNRNADAEFEALKNKDTARFLELIKESGNSSFKYLQNVYPAGSIEHQEVALGLAVTESFLKDQGACRVHGGGFAGTIQAFVPEAKVAAYKSYIEEIFGEGACYVLSICKYGGKKVM